MARRPPATGPAGRPVTCDAETCDQLAQPDHYLCVECWARLPVWLCKDIARARVTGHTRRAAELRTAALEHLHGTISTQAYARIAAQLGERDAAA